MLWWVAHAIAGFGIGGLFLVWGLTILSRGEMSIRIPFLGRLMLEGGAAATFAWAMMLVCPAMIAHAFLTCFDRVKPWAEMVAKAIAALTLLLIIAAFVRHVVG
jgi:hypothetical protein